jgi:hypothetical protein
MHSTHCCFEHNAKLSGGAGGGGEKKKKKKKKTIPASVRLN